MRCAVLFSGGKDSTYAAFLAKQSGLSIKCLITVFSKNPESYMFHTASIGSVEKQAQVMELPLIKQETEGIKEKELADLKKAIKSARENYDINTIVTGAVRSSYQANRIEKICKDLGLNCLNPLWHKPEEELLRGLLDKKFYIVLVGVFAYPLDSSWLGREINEKFIRDLKKLKYPINLAGEGGEYETLVLNCPLFSRELQIASKDISGSENSWQMDVKLK